MTIRSSAVSIDLAGLVSSSLLNNKLNKQTKLNNLLNNKPYVLPEREDNALQICLVQGLAGGVVG